MVNPFTNKCTHAQMMAQMKRGMITLYKVSDKLQMETLVKMQ